MENKSEQGHSVNNDKIAPYKNYAPMVLRYGLSIVFLWFGISQLVNPNNFVGYLPDFLFSSGYANLFVFANGVFEILAAGLLIANKFTSIISALLALHLIGIMVDLGYGETLVRDFGIFVGTTALFLYSYGKKNKN